MHPTKIEVFPYKGRGQSFVGIDLCIHNEDVTVADYCEAMDAYILQGHFERSRSLVLDCEGCDTCCRERIPLTSIDAQRLSEHLGIALADFLKRYAYVHVAGSAVDISLARDAQERCVFLHPQEARCTQYHLRPFVCRTYICTSLSPRAAQLRNRITNSGEDELVRLWMHINEPNSLIIHQAENPQVNEAEWASNDWTGKNCFSQIRLQDLLEPALWKSLWKEES